MPRSQLCSSWRPCRKWACRPCDVRYNCSRPARVSTAPGSIYPPGEPGRSPLSSVVARSSWPHASFPSPPQEGCKVLGRWMAWCARNRFFVFSGVVVLLLGGIWALGHLPLDALPDTSDVQVVLRGSWPGEPPTIIEDQLTYPLVTALRAVPRVQQVRAQTMFGDAFIYVVFQDGTDLYWARSRVLEYLQQIQPRLPPAARVSLGPDATGAGWIYQYVLVDRSHRWNLADLRSLQDWFLRYQLETVPGVAEVASIGGFVRQYQVRLDPDRLRAYSIPIGGRLARVLISINVVGSNILKLSSV